MKDKENNFFKTGLIKDYLAYRDVEFGEDFIPYIQTDSKGIRSGNNIIEFPEARSGTGSAAGTETGSTAEFQTGQEHSDE